MKPTTSTLAPYAVCAVSILFLCAPASSQASPANDHIRGLLNAAKLEAPKDRLYGQGPRAYTRRRHAGVFRHVYPDCAGVGGRVTGALLPNGCEMQVAIQKDAASEVHREQIFRLTRNRIVGSTGSKQSGWKSTRCTRQFRPMLVVLEVSNFRVN